MIKISRNKGSYYWLLLASSLIAIIISIPILYLIFRALSADNLFDLLFRERVLGIIFRSVILVISVTIFSSLIAFFLSYFLVRTNVFLKRTLTVFCCLPIVIPSYVYGMVFVDLMGPKGKVQNVLSSLNINSFPDFYGFWGATIVLTFLTYPYVFLPLRAAYLRMDFSFEDASRSLGKGKIKTFWYITLPLISPALRSGALLVALYVLSDFGAVALLRYETFTWAIMTQYSAAFNRVSAAALSLVLVLLAVLILTGDSFFKGPKTYFSSANLNRFNRVAELDFRKWFVFSGIVIPPLIGVVLPITGLLYWLIRGINSGEIVSIDFMAAFNSTWVAFLASFFTLLISSPIAFLSVRYKGALSVIIEKISYIGFGLPGIVIGLGIVFFSINFAFPLYQSIFVLIFGYGVLFLPVALSAIKTTLTQLNPDLEDASRGLGVGYWSTFWRITIPLIAPSILAGGLLIFLLTLKELPVTMVLAPLNFSSLSLKIWGYASEAYYAKAAVPALFLILLAGPASAYLILKRHEVDIRG